MLTFDRVDPRDDPSADVSELMRMWALDDGTRCVVAVAGPSLELRIVSDGGVYRRVTLHESDRVLETAWLWRLEHELEFAIEAVPRFAQAQRPN